MHKKNLIFTLLLCFFAFLPKVRAANLTVSASAYTIYVGSTVNITAKATDLAGKFSFKSNNLAVLSGGGDIFIDNNSHVYTFTALKAGTAVVTVYPVDVSDYNENSYTASKSVTINVINRQTTPATPPKQNSASNGSSNSQVTPKSSVNYLKSLEIEGTNLNPKFSKDVSDYTVEVKADTTYVNIKAVAEHNKASIIGAGKVNVSEGINTLKIVVTAENGSKRTYTIKLTVQEKNPIIVKTDGKDLTVVRKKDQLPTASAFYSDTNVTINGEQIPAYFGEITGFTLVGLKDSEGNINLYIYDDSNNTYKSYLELTFSNFTFFPMEASKEIIPKHYIKSSILMNDIEVPCYEKQENSEFVLLYGINIENNNEGFYIYDKFENTLQRYDDAVLDEANKEIVILKSIIVGLISIVTIVAFTSAIQGSINNYVKKRKGKKTIENLSNIKKDVKNTQIVDNKKEAKLLEKELKRKEKESKKSRKNKKGYLENTNTIDITDINIKKKNK